jgi:Flp pilus assembly protein CpaB
MTSGEGGAIVPRRRRGHHASAYFLLFVMVLTASGGVYLWLQSRHTRVVWIATVDLAPYHQITRSDMRQVEVRSEHVPAGAAVRGPNSLIGRYPLAAVDRGQPFTLGRLGPPLPAGALAGHLVVGLQVSFSDIEGGTLSRGDRVDILLSSTAPQRPRSGVLGGAIVLDVKRDHHRAGQFTVVCAFQERYESVLLDTGGTARIFIVLDPASGTG